LVDAFERPDSGFETVEVGVPAEIMPEADAIPVIDLGPYLADAESYTCPGMLVYDPAVGCSTLGADDYGYYTYPTVLYGRHPDHRGSDAAWGGVRDIGHGFYHGPGHGMCGMGRTVGVDRGFSAAHYWGGGFAHAGGFGGFHGGGLGGGGHR
jgi:hypothetical protein